MYVYALNAGFKTVYYAIVIAPTLFRFNDNIFA